MTPHTNCIKRKSASTMFCIGYAISEVQIQCYASDETTRLTVACRQPYGALLRTNDMETSIAAAVDQAALWASQIGGRMV